MPDDGHPDQREVFAGDETPSGTTVFLQGLMAMLAEVLDRVDHRLSSLEATLAAQAEPVAATVGPDANDNVTALLEHISERLERLEDREPAKSEAGEEWPEGLRVSLTALGEGITAVRAQVMAQQADIARGRDEETTSLLAALERISQRLERLEEREPAATDTESTIIRLADLSGSVEDIGRRLADLAELLTVSSEAEEEWPEGLQASLTALGQGVEDIKARVTAQGVESTVSRLEDLSAAVDSIGYGLAGMTELMTASSSAHQEWPEELRTALLALGEGLEELRQDLHAQPVTELRGTMGRLEGQLTLLTNQLAAQPAPGAAVAMVAAGLAERFEERTQALTDLLEAHASYVRLTWERIEGILDGGGLDELAVGAALEHVIDNQELMADSMEGVMRTLEGLQAGPHPPADGLPLEMLEGLSTGMQSVVGRVDDVRRRLADLERALEASSQEPGPPDTSTPASLLGRRASSAGRRLAGDVARRGRGRPPRP